MGPDPAHLTGSRSTSVLAAGTAGLDPELVVDPVSVPADLAGNEIVCSTPEGAPGGLSVRIGRPDSSVVDPQALANVAQQSYGGHLAVSEPVSVLGGTLVLTQADDASNNPVWAHW